MEEKLARYFSKESSEEECRQIHEWRSASDKNASEFLRYKMIWATSNQNYRSPYKADQITSGGIPFYRTNWFRYAASVILVLGLSLSFYYYSGYQFGFGSGMTEVVKLKDGSYVTLYKDATVTELAFSDDSRVVSMTGKAYFEVKGNKERSFVIYTDEAKIEVLGTSFLVDTEKEKTTEVVVETGVVTFSQNPENYKGRITAIKLEAGEKGMITPNARGLIKQNNRDANYLAWANYVLSFRAEELEEVARVVSEVYGFEVRFDNPAQANCKLTATYKKKSPEQIANLLAETFGFTYEISGKVITLSGPGC